MTDERVVSLYPEAGDPGVTVEPAGSDLRAPEALAEADVVAAVEFEALLRKGRENGGLTQDDVVSVLESVELTDELITGVVERIREAGIEFTYDTGETTIVPLAVASAPVEPPVRLVPVEPAAAKPARKPAARRTRTSGSTTSSGFTEGDSFRGSAADPVQDRKSVV